ncbi:MAG: class I SAM-dependent methyltransferase, partial [Thermoplasmatota archaeon]
MSDKKKVASRYDRWKGFYDLVDNFPLVSRPQKRWKREAVDRLDLEGDELVLDIGTGSGEIIPWIAEKLDEGKVIGTDISQGMVGLTNDKIDEAGIQERAEAVYDDIEDS